MKERPILFSAPMVRAILAGTKTQTRRVVKMPTKGEYVRPDMGGWEASTFGGKGCTFSNGAPTPEIACVWNQTTGTIVSSIHEPGDRLWVRETWAEVQTDDGNAIAYCADDGQPPVVRWRPSIHMPRSASRILLEVTNVRAQRVREITDEDARAEGCPAGADNLSTKDFHELWDLINAKRGFGWDTNPWVWAIAFRRIAWPT
jgi:hypothetical protein